MTALMLFVFLGVCCAGVYYWNRYRNIALVLDSEPSGCTVYLGSNAVGRTPLVLTYGDLSNMGIQAHRNSYILDSLHTSRDGLSVGPRNSPSEVRLTFAANDNLDRYDTYRSPSGIRMRPQSIFYDPDARRAVINFGKVIQVEK